MDFVLDLLVLTKFYEKSIMILSAFCVFGTTDETDGAVFERLAFGCWCHQVESFIIDVMLKFSGSAV